MSPSIQAVRTIVAAFSGAAFLTAPAFGEAPAIGHDAVLCLVVDRHPRLQARFDPANQVSRGRLRFRPAGGAHWYSVPMTREADSFAGVLPKPTKKLKKLDYYVEVTATDFATGRTVEYTPEVVAGLGACQGAKAAGASVGSATVILEVPAGAPTVPPGFSPSGIVAAGSAGAAGVGAATGGGLGAGAVVGGVLAAGAAAAGVVAASSSGDDSGPGRTTPPPIVTQTFTGTISSTNVPCAFCSWGFPLTVTQRGTVTTQITQGTNLSVDVMRGPCAAQPPQPGCYGFGLPVAGANSGGLSVTLPAGEYALLVNSNPCIDACNINQSFTLPFVLTVTHP